MEKACQGWWNCLNRICVFFAQTGWWIIGLAGSWPCSLAKVLVKSPLSTASFNQSSAGSQLARLTLLTNEADQSFDFRHGWRDRR